MALTKTELQNLSTLFLSKDDNNTQLAFEIMEPHGFVQDLVTEIFVVYKLTRSLALKTKAAQLLENHGSENIKKAMNRKLEFRTESTIKKNIVKYVKSSAQELDGLKFARALYNKYDLGFAYLMKEGNTEEIRSILQNHIEGKTFTLKNKGLTTMPKEFFELIYLEEINLSGNKITNLSAKFKVFKQLRKLDLQNNCLKKIHNSIASLEYLEELNLNNNLIEVFPTVLGKFKQLRRLSIENMLNISGLVKGVHIPNNFFQLKLHYLSVSKDSLNGNQHGYQGLPFFSSLETTGDQYLDLAPLALAKQAFEAGQKSVVYYLLFFAEAPYRQKVLASFYDPSTQTMDLSGMYIKYLPKELASFDIRVLNMKETGFKYNFSLVDSTEEGLRAIGMLDQLEELYLDENGLDQIPSSVFNCSKLKILSLHGNSNIQSIPSNIQQLKELEVLDLDSSSWDPIDFPEEIKTLKKLKMVHVNALYHKTETIKEHYIQRLKDLFADHITLNRYGAKSST